MHVIGENSEVIMQNPTHDKIAGDKKSAETLKKEAANKHPAQKSDTQKSTIKPEKK